MKRIEFLTTAADYLAVSSFVKRRINEDIRLRLNDGWVSKTLGAFSGIIILVVFVLPLMLFVGNNPASLNIYVGYLFAILFLLLFIGSKIHKKRFKKLINFKLCNKSPSTVIIGDQGVEELSESGHINYKWQGIATIDHWQDYILFLSPLYQGLFIPVRAFGSQEERDIFLNEARNYLTNASNKTTTPTSG